MFFNKYKDLHDRVVDLEAKLQSNTAYFGESKVDVERDISKLEMNYLRLSRSLEPKLAALEDKIDLIEKKNTELSLLLQKVINEYLPKEANVCCENNTQSSPEEILPKI